MSQKHYSEEVFFHLDLEECVGPCPRARGDVGPSRQLGGGQYVERYRLVKNLECLRTENFDVIGAVCVGRQIQRGL